MEGGKEPSVSPSSDEYCWAGLLLGKGVGMRSQGPSQGEWEGRPEKCDLDKEEQIPQIQCNLKFPGAVQTMSEQLRDNSLLERAGTEWQSRKPWSQNVYFL